MSQLNLESYPPVFRLENPQSTEFVECLSPVNYTKKHNILEDDPLPLIDLNSLDLDNIEDACKNWGLLRLVNHGIPLTLLNQLQDCAKKIFSLSFESKQALIIDPLSYFWGTPVLTPSGTALERGPKSINWVEGINVPLNQISQLHVDLTIDSFRLALEEYGNHVTRIAKTIFDAMIKKLNLDQEKTKDYMAEETGIIRVYRYPQCSMADETMGMEAHSDSSLISVVNQEHGEGGLELLKDDKWIHIDPIPHTLILNLGDMMQAVSNDEYKSAMHRVKVNKSKERISICYFVFPAEESVIQSLKYKPFSYTDFQKQVQEDVKTLGFKIGLQRFKLTQPEPAS